jgi:ABC-2 type transport system permease protein
MTSLTGTVALTRFILRRDRIRILVWIVALVALAALTTVGIEGLFPTQAALDQTAAATAHNAAMIAFNGAPQGLNTVGGQVAFQFGAGGMVLVALMSIFMVGRLTRGEEEAGRLEVVRSLPVGIHANTLAAALTVAAMNLIVGVLTAAVLIAQGLPAAGSVTFGVSFILVGLVFGGVALLVAQVTESTRVVYGTAGAVLGAAYVLRAVGDIGDGTVSWFSPIGVAQKARPFADERWWPLLLLVAVTVLLVVAATALTVRRDLGAGLVAARPGPPRQRPGSGTLWVWPSGCSGDRCSDGAPASWSSASLRLDRTHRRHLHRPEQGPRRNAGRRRRREPDGFVLRFLLPTDGAHRHGFRHPVRHAGAERGNVHARRPGPGDARLALAVRGESPRSGLRGQRHPARRRRSGHWPHLRPRGRRHAKRSAPVRGRPRLRAGHVDHGRARHRTRRAGTALVGVSWAILVACVVEGFLGAVLGLPRWLSDLSPFERVPQLPAASLTLLPLVVMSAVAAGLTLIGLTGLRRRDIGRI